MSAGGCKSDNGTKNAGGQAGGGGTYRDAGATGAADAGGHEDASTGGQGTVRDAGVGDSGDHGRADSGNQTADAGHDAATVTCDPTMPVQCPVCANETNCGSASYTDNGNGTETSSCCSLVWQQATDPGTFSETDAKAYCAGLSLAGATWRVPTIAELKSLVVLGSSPTIDTVAFPNAPSEKFWSASKEPGGASNAWAINFADGIPFTTSFDIRYKYHVRCVH